MQQIVFDTAELIYRKGITHVVISPGSRNAPLTISFARHPKITCYSVVDERSAGFIALGMALKLKSPIALCCTSGTALLNYAPAVAEAYYQQIPLLIISADRPPEWIDQRDGQTINQLNALGNFVRGFFQLPVDQIFKASQWEYNRKLNEAINLLDGKIPGPVHINIPFREPFYPTTSQDLQYSQAVRIIEKIQPSPNTFDFPMELWEKHPRRLIVIGQHGEDAELDSLLSQLIEKEQVVVVTDIISNQHNPDFVHHHDLFLMNSTKDIYESLKPELLITTGKSIISKNLKLFLRNYQPKHHWHFDPTGTIADTFMSLDTVFESKLHPFIDKLIQLPDKDATFTRQLRHNYVQGWKLLNSSTEEKLHVKLKKAPFCEFSVMWQVFKHLPNETDLHLANSMPVRYANFIHPSNSGMRVYSNRGTSGIDGTNGTAVGNAIVGDRPVVLITGDLSFFYDRNAFFHHHDLSKLKIIILNNQGGGIFRLINGPSGQPELETYFETRHQHSARYTAIEYQFDYYKASNEIELLKGLKSLFKNGSAAKILEVFTDPQINQKLYNKIKEEINEQSNI